MYGMILMALFAASPQVQIGTGAGQFAVSAEHDETAHDVAVHYYKPGSFTPDSPIIMIMPGGGRNGDDYRDSWIDASEKYGLLVLSPSFSEDHYPGSASYNIGRMIYDVDRATLTSFKLRTDPSEWIFEDIDRIYKVAAEAVGSTRTGYDIFGHSAGGQIVHRMIMFAPDTKIDRAVAANSGWYTLAIMEDQLPRMSEPFPFGLNGAPITNEGLRSAFARNLTVFLGEMDNAGETRGHLRRTPETNRQGPHRLARGRYFYDTAWLSARILGADFAWKLEVVEGVGHSYRKMGAAAAEFLYGDGDRHTMSHAATASGASDDRTSSITE